MFLGYGISHRALKIIFDDHDNFVKPPHPTEYVWGLIKEHFNVETRADILPHLYEHFDKAAFAGKYCVPLYFFKYLN